MALRIRCLARPSLSPITRGTRQRAGGGGGGRGGGGGSVEVGETSVAIAVSAPDRQDALGACADVIEALKARVPLWKKELYEGGEKWIGRGS